MTSMDVTTGRTILIIEDDEMLAETCAEQLRSEGYVPLIAATGKEGARLLQTQHPDLVLLDLSLPDMDGVALCQTIRNESVTPIIIVSGRDKEQDRIQGLNLGADDYVTKPISLRELTARVQAVLRRTDRAAAEEAQMAVGDVRLDLTYGKVDVSGRNVSLTPNEMRLLAALMRNPGQVLSREALLQTVWQESSANLHLVEVHIANLRSKIEENPRRPKRLVTVRSSGYKFVETNHTHG